MATAPALSLTQIGQISVHVKDLDRAVAFYRDILGIRHWLTVPGQLAVFECGGIRLLLSKPSAPEFDHPSSIIYFQVENLDDAFQRLKERQVHIVELPHVIARLERTDLWMGFFHDSEGNLLSLMNEQPHS